MSVPPESRYWASHSMHLRWKAASPTGQDLIDEENVCVDGGDDPEPEPRLIPAEYRFTGVSASSDSIPRSRRYLDPGRIAFR